MTDRNKFEEMLERLVNEDREGAEELFHEIVVEKSRSIYQSIIESEEDDLDESDDDDLDESDDDDLDESDEDDLDESDEDELDESAEEDDEEDDLEEMFGLDEFEGAEEDPMGDMGGDATDDMMGDLEGGDDEEGDEEGDDEGGADAAFADLEDALDALKAEFEAMMGGEGGEEGDDEDGEEGDMDMDMGMDDEEPEEESFQATITPLESKKVNKSAGEQMREYVEKVTGKMGDNGANTKSIVAGKNDMGGTASNILRTDTEQGVEANKGKLKGSALTNQSAKVEDAGNVNKVGNKKGAATKMSNQPGHGAEKKGKPETADKSAGSMLNGAPKRAK